MCFWNMMSLEGVYGELCVSTLGGVLFSTLGGRVTSSKIFASCFKAEICDGCKLGVLVFFCCIALMRSSAMLDTIIEDLFGMLQGVGKNFAVCAMDTPFVVGV